MDHTLWNIKVKNKSDRIIKKKTVGGCLTIASVIHCIIYASTCNLIFLPVNSVACVWFIYISALCNGLTNLNGACKARIDNSHIIYADGTIQYYPEGSCDSPNSCTCTKAGFYSGGPICLSRKLLTL